MNPPFSIIFFTTLSGMGQGLFIALFLAQLSPGSQQSAWFYVAGLLLTLLLLVIGLIASILHLGHPERAWRSAARWRTSWLSREVIALPMLMLLVFICLLVNFIPGWNPLLGYISTMPIHLALLLSTITLFFIFVLFICTGMIYACLKFLQEWHTPLTIINFILLGCASGFVLAVVVANMLAPQLTLFYTLLAIAFIAFAALFRNVSLIRNKRLRPKSTIQTALGIPHAKIVQKSQGAMGGSFNTREFFHGKTKFFLRSIKWIFLVLVFVIPIILLLLQLYCSQPMFALFALVIQYLGLLCERWYFFAEAKHPQNLYYQAIS